jgi:hypothetical protein
MYPLTVGCRGLDARRFGHGTTEVSLVHDLPAPARDEGESEFGGIGCATLLCDMSQELGNLAFQDVFLGGSFVRRDS